jgi:hypothetical protein
VLGMGLSTVRDFCGETDEVCLCIIYRGLFRYTTD